MSSKQDGLFAHLQSQQLIGPPKSAEDATFWDLIEFLLEAILRETRENRRAPVIDFLLSEIKVRLQVAGGHETLAAQQDALKRDPSGVRRAAEYPHDLRKTRDRLPLDLPNEHNFVRKQIASLKKTHRIPRLVRELRNTYPELDADQAEQVAHASPALGSHIVLAARYKRSPSYVKTQIAELRKPEARIGLVLKQLRKTTGHL